MTSLLLPPLARAGLQSGTIMSIADLFTQAAIERQKRLDWRRTGRWAVAGLCIHGPYFFAGFHRLDARFGVSASWKIVAQKTAAAQFLLFPPYLVALFSFFGLVERGSPADALARVRRCVPAAFAGGCVFWPVANLLNFAFVPSRARVPYLAASAGVWNSYLSWTDHKAARGATTTATRKAPPKADGKAAKAAGGTS